MTMRSTDAGRAAGRRMPFALAVAVAMAWGAILGWWLRPDAVVVSVIAGTLAVIAIVVVRRRIAWRLVACAASLAGSVLATMDAERHGVDPAWIGGGMPVDILGVVATAPRVRDTGSDALSPFVPVDASQSFVLERATVGPVDAISPHGDGRVLVRVAGLAPLPGRGRTVRVRGWASTRTAPLNPGHRPREPTIAVEVPSAALVVPCDEGWSSRWLAWLRSRLHHGLGATMPGWATDGERALVAAMSVGIRLPGLDRHAAEFRDAGMSHVLAISGFNVAVLVAAAALAARAAGARSATRSVVALAVAVVFLAVTEPETSVIRAGFGAALGALVGIRGGRARGLGILGATAIVAMLLDVGCLRGPGFQLSYGVVLALLVLAPAPVNRWTVRVRARCSSALAPLSAAHEASVIAGSSLAGAACAALVAWSASTPIAMAHGGSLAPLAAPLSVLTMPVAAVTTVAGVVAMVTAEAVPPVGWLAGSVAAFGARSLAMVAAVCAEAVPGLGGGAPIGFGAAVGVIGAVAVAWIGGSRAVRTVAWVAVIASVCALLRDQRPEPKPVASAMIVVDRLALGNGRCTVIRHGATTVLVDAGAMSVDAGSRVVVPALHALGVSRVDAIVLTSPSLVAISAVPEVLRSFDVGMIVCPEHVAERLERDRGGPGARLVSIVRSADRSIGRAAVDGWHAIDGVHVRLNMGRSPRGDPRIDTVDVRAANATPGAPTARILVGGGDGAPSPPGAVVGRPGDAAERVTLGAGGGDRARWDGERWVPWQLSATEARVPAATP
jgi:ComEC/Rec2-related protein